MVHQSYMLFTVTSLRKATMTYLAHEWLPIPMIVHVAFIVRGLHKTLAAKLAAEAEISIVGSHVVMVSCQGGVRFVTERTTEFSVVTLRCCLYVTLAENCFPRDGGLSGPGILRSTLTINKTSSGYSGLS